MSRPIRILAVLIYAACVVLFSYQDGFALVTKVASAVLLAVTLATLLGSRTRALRRVNISPIFLIWSVWMVWATVGVFFAHDQDIAFDKLITLLQLGVVSVCIVHLLNDVATSNYIFISLPVLMTISSMLSQLWPEKFSDLGGRAFGTFGNANMFGAALVFASIFALARAVARPRLRVMVVACFFLGIFMYFIIQSESRQSLLAFLAGVVVLFLPPPGRRKMARSSGTIAVGVAAILVVSLAGGAFVVTGEWQTSRFGQFVESTASGSVARSDTSTQQRLYFYSRVIDIVQASPFAGIGLDNFRVFSSATDTATGMYAHSTYLEVVAATGFVGLILYFAIYVYFGWRLMSLRRSWLVSSHWASIALLSALGVATVILDFFAVSYYSKIHWLVFCYMIAELSRLDAIRADASVRNSWQTSLSVDFGVHK